MYLGRFQLGDSIPLSLHSVNTSGTPTLPDAAPQARIHDNTGSLVETVKLPIKDRYRTTGYFDRRWRLSSSYSTGRYLVVYQWTISSTTYQAAACFDVFGGGDAEGMVIALKGTTRPEAVQLLYETQRGELYAGRNPK